MATTSSKKPKKAKTSPDWTAVDPLEVFAMSKDMRMTLGGEPISETELKNLQQEVKALKAFHIWRIMTETVKQKAIQTGFVESENWERTMSGKMMLHNLGILKSIVDSIERVPQVNAPIAPKPPLHTQKFG